MGNPNTALFPNAVVTDNDLLVASNLFTTTLNGSINNSVTSVTLTSVTGLSFPCALVVDTEIMWVSSITGFVATVVRGKEGTAAASHSSGASVFAYLTAQHHNQLAAEIKAIEANVLSSFPFAIVQQAQTYAAPNVTNLTVTFPQAAASSGNTLWMIIACDSSQTVTISGWTLDINQAQASFTRLIIAHKTSASDTSATISFGGSNAAVLFFELVGARTLDVSSSNGGANATSVTLPSITPTAGSAVFGAVAYTSAGGSPAIGVMPPWTFIAQTGTAANAQRSLLVEILNGRGTGVAIVPPGVGLPILYGGSGLAWSSFSIK